MKLHSFGLQITQHYGTIEIHLSYIVLPFFIFIFKVYSILPPPSKIPRKLCTIQIFYLPLPYIFPFEGVTLNKDSF